MAIDIDALIKEELERQTRELFMEGCSDKENKDEDDEDEKNDKDEDEDEDEDEELTESETDALHSVLVEGSVIAHLMEMEGVDEFEDLSEESQEIAESLAIAAGALAAGYVLKKGMKKGKQRELQDRIDRLQQRIAIARKDGKTEKISDYQQRISKLRKEIGAMKTLGQGKSGFLRPSHTTIMKKRAEQKTANQNKVKQ